MTFKAALSTVSNRGSLTKETLSEFVQWAAPAPDEIFAPKKDDSGETDIYTAVKPYLGPWEGLEHRRAVMLEVLRVTMLFESSGNWKEDYDKHNPDENTSLKKSAGPFQVSPNSLYFGADLKSLVNGVVGNLDPDAFRAAMMSNHRLAIEYAARLLRHTIRHNGPVNRGEINAWLKKEAVKEFQSAIALAQGLLGRPAAPPPGPSGPVDSGNGLADSRSEGNIATLHPRIQPLARQLIKDAAAAGITAKVTSGTRTYAEQDALYAQGRPNGKIVTNAKGGQSNHNFGIAFDVTVFNGASPVWDGPQYETLGELGKKLGLEWGGDWASIQDQPHFELRPDWAKDMSEGMMLSSLRLRHSDGRDAFA